MWQKTKINNHLHSLLYFSHFRRCINPLMLGTSILSAGSAYFEAHATPPYSQAPGTAVHLKWELLAPQDRQWNQHQAQNSPRFPWSLFEGQLESCQSCTPKTQIREHNQNTCLCLYTPSNWLYRPPCTWTQPPASITLFRGRVHCAWFTTCLFLGSYLHYQEWNWGLLRRRHSILFWTCLSRDKPCWGLHRWMTPWSRGTGCGALWDWMGRRGSFGLVAGRLGNQVRRYRKAFPSCRRTLLSKSQTGWYWTNPNSLCVSYWFELGSAHHVSPSLRESRRYP